MAETTQPGDSKTAMFIGGQQYVGANAVTVAIARRQWTTGLCDCCSDMGACCFAYFLPWCYLCKVYSDAGEGFCSCLWGGIVPLRVKVRTERGIQGSICEDFWTTLCCPFCSILQVGREVKSTAPLI